MHALVHRIHVLRAVAAGDEHIRAHRKAHEQVDDQVDECRGGTHRRQRRVAGVAAHHDDVRRVEQQLQNARAHQREGKGQDLAQKRAAGHVHLIAASQTDAPSFSHIRFHSEITSVSYHSTKPPGRKPLFNMFFTFHRFAGGRRQAKSVKKAPASAKSGALGGLFPCISPGVSYIIGTDFFPGRPAGHRTGRRSKG